MTAVRGDELIAGYRPAGPGGAHDEAVCRDATVRDDYVAVLLELERLGPEGLTEAERVRDGEQRARGVLFRVNGEEQARPFPVDLVPRLVPGQDWADLSAGLVQRARALDAFLHDVYGRRAVVRDGVLPAWVLEQCPGLQPERGERLARQQVRAHVCGMDLVRDSNGRWSVLEDNLRVPSGLAYAVQNRRLTELALPGLTVPPGVLPVDGLVPALLRTLQDASPGAGAVVVLSDGPTDSAWFEHSMLAREMGVPVVMAHELSARDDAVFLGDEAVGVLYLRVGDDSLAVATLDDGAPLLPALLAAAQAGSLTLANALGNGVADDKAVYAYVGEFVRYYLAEEPLLADVPTYLCGEPEQRGEALARLAELVVKPVDGYGGQGVLLGPYATAQQLEQAAAAVRAQPHRWIAQEMVQLSTAPCWSGGRLVPRHVDLRAFVLQGESTVVAPAALTRVAPEGSMVVNSSRGGGSKDTWLGAERARP